MRSQIKQIREMAKDPSGHAFFGWLSSYVRNTESSTVEQAERETTRWGRENIDKKMIVTRSEVISIMKSLDELQLGRFIVGRRGSESRFEFWTNRSQIGQAALGSTNSLEIYKAPVKLESDVLIESHRMLIANALDLPVSAVIIRLKESAS